MSEEHSLPANLPAVSKNLLTFSPTISDLERMLYQQMSEIVLAATPQTNVVQLIQKLKRYATTSPEALEIWEKAFQRFQTIWNASLQ